MYTGDYTVHYVIQEESILGEFVRDNMLLASFKTLAQTQMWKKSSKT